MLMTNDNIRLYRHDRLLQKTLLRLIPRWVTPNQITIFRGCLIPVVLWFLWKEVWTILTPLFLFTAFTDVLDGSLARTRKQITLWGTMADPIVDKLLIGSVVILFVAKEINPIFATMIVVLELLIVCTALVRHGRGKEYVSANWYGKIKMLFQVIGVLALLLARSSGIELFIPFSVGTLCVAIAFAIISLYTYGL